MLLAKYYQVDQIEDHETSGEWRNMVESKMRTEFLWGKSEAKRPLERPRLRWTVDRKRLAQDRHELQALVNTARAFTFHKMRGDSAS